MEITPRQRPPRSFNIPTTISLLLGGFYIYFGAFFMLIGSVVFWTLGGMGDWSAITQSVGDDWLQTEGRVHSVTETQATENDKRIYAYDYSYVIDQNSYLGTAYTRGQQFSVDQQVTVIYHPEQPNISVVEGARRSEFSFWIIPFTLIFPLVGLTFVIIGFLRNRKGYTLLKYGRFSRAKPVDKQATMTRINKQTVYKYRFAFDVAGKTYEATCKTHICGPVEDEETEKILFDPLHPANNVVYDALSNAPDFDAFGKMVPNSWWKAWPALLLLAVLIVNYLGAASWGLL